MRGAAPTACIALLALAGCSLGADDEPPPARGIPREIAALVERLEAATRRGDYASVCTDLLSAQARRRAGGRDCPRLLRSAAGEVRRPRLEVVRITVRGRFTEARVRSRAAGQPTLVDTVRFVREGSGYRIDALSG